MKTTDWILEHGGFIYQVNNAGTNVFSFQVQGGIKDDGARITVEDKEAIARRIFTAVNTFDQAREVIKKCAEKLALYRDQHSGEYVGGMEYSALIREVNNVLTAMEATHE